MIKQVQKFPRCLEPGNEGVSAQRSRRGGAGAGAGRTARARGCATKLWRGWLPAGSAPRPHPRFPGRQPSPRLSPPSSPLAEAACVERVGGESFLPAAHPGLCGHFPWDGRRLGPFSARGGGAGRLLQGFLQAPRCQVPCETWFCEVSADTA